MGPIGTENSHNNRTPVKTMQLMGYPVFAYPFICSTTGIQTRYSRSRYSSSRIGAVYWSYYPLYYYQAGLYSRRNNYPSGEQLLRKGVLLPDKSLVRAMACRRAGTIITNNASIPLIEPLGTNFNEIQIKLQPFSSNKNHVNSQMWCLKCTFPLR